MAESFPKIITDIKSMIIGTHRTPKRINTKKSYTYSYHIQIAENQRQRENFERLQRKTKTKQVGPNET